MNDAARKRIDDAVWIAASLFNRGKSTGSTANLSFRCDGRIYITGTGTCFGRLTPDDFAELDENGTLLGDAAPSKELPLHTALYVHNPDIHAIIHTHSFYTVLWSCYATASTLLPQYTPYLGMKVGTPGWVPYAPPGSPELFDAFAQCLGPGRAYILRNHGPVVGGADIFDAFYALEELEESARLAWELRKEHAEEL